MPCAKLSIPFLIGIAACLPLGAQSPQSLQAVSATSKQVQLSWTPAAAPVSGFTVERKPLGGDYRVLNTTPTAGATFADATIDPFTTYVYRVSAVSGLTTSAPSNEVTVGPPPTGFNVAVPVPASLGSHRYFGNQLNMILDANGDPALSYYFFDPNEDGDPSDGTLYFVAWDRANYSWKGPVKIAVAGELTETNAQVSLARDASNNVYGIAWQAGGGTAIGMAFSKDGGATWSAFAAVSSDSVYSLSAPSLALGKGQVYLAFGRAFDGVRYVTGAQTDDPAKWTSTLAPFLSDATSGWYPAISIALDNAGAPGIAYVLDGDDGYNRNVVFWRPGVGSAVKATDTNGLQNDYFYLKLAFAGALPRIAFYARRDDDYFATNGHSDWVIAALDGGVNWGAAVPIPPDGNEQLGAPALAIGSAGQGALVADTTGGNLSGVMCGWPKLARSADLFNWTTCSPTGGPLPEIYAFEPQVVFAGNDKLYIAFGNTGDGSTDLPYGVIVWREP